jgi:hypothetical protein
MPQLVFSVQKGHQAFCRKGTSTAIPFIVRGDESVEGPQSSGEGVRIIKIIVPRIAYNVHATRTTYSTNSAATTFPDSRSRQAGGGNSEDLPPVVDSQ